MREDLTLVEEHKELKAKCNQAMEDKKKQREILGIRKEQEKVEKAEKRQK